MPNDAKLGLLAGIAGVLAAAVLVAPKGPGGVTAAVPPPEPAAVRGTPSAPPGLPPAKVVVPGVPMLPTAASRARSEVEGTPTAGRPVRD